MIHRRQDIPEEERSARELVLCALEGFGENVFKYEGPDSGPSVFLIGGTHGNEILGILAVAALREEIESGSVIMKAGTIRLALGNPRAIEVDARTALRGRDLNRLFTDDVLKSESSENWESARARVIAQAIRNSDLTIDLHSTNRPSPPFVCSSLSEAHRSVYRWLPRIASIIDPQRIISGGGGSIDEYADDCGKVGICYESGQANDIRAVAPVYSALKSILIERRIIEGELPELPLAAEAEYIVVGSVPYDAEREFTFVEGKAEGFAPLVRGEIIGYRGAEAAVSPVDGIILFPKKSEHQSLAGVVCYLARQLPREAV